VPHPKYDWIVFLLEFGTPYQFFNLKTDISQFKYRQRQTDM